MYMFLSTAVGRRVIELRSDIKALSDQIKAALEVALAKPVMSGKQPQIQSERMTVPFALCNGVAPGSPAAQAVRSINGPLIWP